MSHIFEKERDALNREIVIDLVSKYFALEENSLKNFKEYLMSPFKNPIIGEHFGNDLRARFKVKRGETIEEIEEFEEFDTSWLIFKKNFKSFIEKYNITHKDFLLGRGFMSVEKNEVKITNELEKFYFDSSDSNQLLFNDCIEKFLIDNGIPAPTFEGSKAYFRMGFNDALQKINNSKLPKNLENTEIVFSANFADWFLCSTGDSWGSCLNLNSPHQEAYWAGLPGLAGDKNRLMMYVTDGKKKNYRGIEVDRFLSRTWILTDDKDSLKYARYYPKKILEEIFIEYLTNIKLLPIGLNYVSKYPIDLIFHKNNKSSFIYHDGTHFGEYNTSDNTIKIIGGNGGAYFYEKGKSSYLCGSFLTIPCGLEGIIEDETNVIDYSQKNSYECYHCGTVIREGDVFWAHDDSFCEECFNERYSSCHSCGTVMHNDDAYYTDYERYCEGCFHERYFSCDNCGHEIPIGEEREIDNNYYCARCSENFTRN